MEDNIEAKQDAKAVAKFVALAGATYYEIPEIGNKTVSGAVKKEEGDIKMLMFGPRNKYPYEMERLAERSPTHGAILKLKTKKTAGSEWVIEPLGNGQAAASSRLDYLFSGSTKRKFSMAISKDYEIHNGFAVLVSWGYMPTGKQIYVSKWEHVPFKDVRIMLDKDNEVMGYRVASSWDVKAKGDLYDPFTGIKPPPPVEDKPQVLTKQMFYYAGGGTPAGEYPKPDYEQGIVSANTEIGITDYYDAEVNSGFQAPMIIELKGPLPDETAREQFKADIKKMQGPRGTRAYVAFSGSEKDDMVVIHQSEDNKKDTKFLETNTTITQKICTAHQLSSPVLAGIPGSGSLGGNGNELATAEMVFQNTVIADHQTDIQEALTDLLKKGMTGESLTITPRILFAEATPTT